MDLIPIEEKEKWAIEIKDALVEANKMSSVDKIYDYNNELSDRCMYQKAFLFTYQNALLLDCQNEALENKNEELQYRLDNYGNYDENRIKEIKSKTVMVPYTDVENRERGKKMFMKNLKQIKLLNKSLKN